jgi:hypothetical protein
MIPKHQTFLISLIGILLTLIFYLVVKNNKLLTDIFNAQTLAHNYQTILVQYEKQLMEYNLTITNTERDFHSAGLVLEKYTNCSNEMKLLTQHFSYAQHQLWRDDHIRSREIEAQFNRNDPGYYPSTNPYRNPQSELPLLAIVVTIDPDTLNFYSAEMSAWACYCSLHGYHFYEEHMQLQKLDRTHHNKQRLIQKYLPYFQWIIFIDAGSWVINRTKSFEELLDNNYDVILQMGENNEILTNSVIIRNSPYGRTFLDNWMKFENNIMHKYYDNIFLTYSVLRDMKPPHWERCIEIYKDNTRANYYAEFVTCAYEVNILSGNYKTWNNIRLSPILSSTSWFRNFDNPEYKFHNKAFPVVDFVLWGKSLYKIIPEEDVYCMEENIDPNSVRNNLYMTSEQAIEYAKLYNFSQYPLCTRQNNNVCSQ